MCYEIRKATLVRPLYTCTTKIIHFSAKSKFHFFPPLVISHALVDDFAIQVPRKALLLAPATLCNKSKG